MEKTQIHTEMPELPVKPDAPPSYHEAYPTAPPADMAPMMPPSVACPFPMQLQPQQKQQTFIQQQPVDIENLPPLPTFGPQPCLVTCPYCFQQQRSTVRMEPTKKTHLIAALMCLAGGICCVWIPYHYDSFKTANHYCWRCNAHLGSYNK
ncbi:lipopolysaccharide-induced tumor necrosis factor-alpha factor homolog [Episyrphus balteatus]|uniref:lipopolysaccharide-induced tumor necrosis factor-alpha factor homolog n=1 Tax=Episyrphus balteatus TaxID=286459 RepID=UPI0024860243|nr:lipopolysaccharide-induced tumor necrosis factor-alpha factor homolog [Episyrphus balteatus]